MLLFEIENKWYAENDEINTCEFIKIWDNNNRKLFEGYFSEKSELIGNIDERTKVNTYRLFRLSIEEIFTLALEVEKVYVYKKSLLL